MKIPHSDKSTYLWSTCFEPVKLARSSFYRRDHRRSLVTQLVKNLPVMQETTCNIYETWGSIPGLGRFLGEGNSNPTSILAWEILWTEEPGGL